MAHFVQWASRMNRAPRIARISITDRCDLACVYCRPPSGDWCIPRERRLDVAAWAALFNALAQSGVHRLRLTGGEPLLHPFVVSLVEAAAKTSGIDDVALTTNATRLELLAQPLRDAGLRRLNISVDSLREERFVAMTRGGSLTKVMRGVEAALAAGFEEIKSNTVVLGPGPGGVRNDDELSDIATWAWSLGITPRFIELMPIGIAVELEGRFVSYATMRERLAGILDGLDTDFRPDANRGPARYVRAADGSGKRIGFITGTSMPFCDGCDRIRVTSDGSVVSCLATNACVSVAGAARAGDGAGLVRGVRDAWMQKPDTTSWRGTRETSARRVSMRVLGG